MLARSSLLVLLAGCDLVFGVNGQPAPCELGSFDEAARTEIVEADEFSVDWDQTFAVISQVGLSWEVSLSDRIQKPIDLGVYMNLALALAPEGHAVFYTTSVEPPTLAGALRGDNAWQLDARVPIGTYAGTPSADVFGPRRVLVRMRPNDTDVQEYEDQDGRWVTVGAPFELASEFPPNLTPNGLTMVYAGFNAAGEAGVFAHSRNSVDEPFGDAVVLSMQPLHRPQLCGQCQQLYVIDGSGEYNMLVRLDR